MSTSYADLLKQLTAQYNQGRITLQAFRTERALLLDAADAQYNNVKANPAITPPTVAAPVLSEEPSADDITAIQYPPEP